MGKQNDLTDWRSGNGVIRHRAETVKRLEALPMGEHAHPLFSAADRLTNAAMWLAVHQTYARTVYLDGRALKPEDFKSDPQGHLGGALNMVPAYVGFLLANALSGVTRAWVMEQGHAVAAIDSVNLLVGNLSEAHAARYGVNDTGLTRFAQDFYSYALNNAGKPDSPLGSHVNPNTAGGVLEGGYLGFAGLEYVHMPLPGEHLVAFLSDGAWEEQKGSDWAPRWWRAHDCGSVVPVMIANGRRIDQRTTMDQQGGARWFARYLKLQGFDPVIIDGRDPLAFAWAIIDSEQRLRKYARDNAGGQVRLPYVIAVAPKGAGFVNEGSNAAHNLPLGANPFHDAKAAKRFNTYVRKLWVPEDALRQSISLLRNHAVSGRCLEKDHPIANRDVRLETVPQPHFVAVGDRRKHRPMDAIDAMFRQTVLLNPGLRPRVGNPDELLSNRMDDTLAYAKYRVTDVEQGNDESLTGNVITALNEEAVAAAAFGNKGGINLIVTYEAFGEKMHGIARQEVIFARHQKEIGKPAGWLSVPLVLTSHSWENGKNELSHQDTSMAECMLAESADVSRVFFPPDYNSASLLMHKLYQTRGEVWTMVVAKQPAAVLFSEEACETLYAQGAIRLDQVGYRPEQASLALVAIGTYQLQEVLKASQRLSNATIPHCVVYVQEPGRLRTPRNAGEQDFSVPDAILQQLLPASIKHIVFITHTRPEPMTGVLARVSKGRTMEGLGFVNEGGTLDIEGMLFVNRCSWAHILERALAMLGTASDGILSPEERDALCGKTSPDGVIRHGGGFR